MKRVLIGLGVVLVLVALAAGGVIYSAFANNRPIVDGQKLADGVQVVKDGFVSAVILDAAPGKVVLIDSGNDKAAASIKAALNGRTVQGIFLTHGHPDHTNGCRAFPGVDIYAMENEVGLVGDAAHVTHP